MVTATIEVIVTELVVEQVTATAPEPRVEIRVDPQPESVSMSKTGTTSCGGLVLLDDELINLVVMSLNMESWCRTEQLRAMCGSRTSGWSLPGVMSD
jgi:hypothetical protein